MYTPDRERSVSSTRFPTTLLPSVSTFGEVVTE